MKDEQRKRGRRIRNNGARKLQVQEDELILYHEKIFLKEIEIGLDLTHLCLNLLSLLLFVLFITDRSHSIPQDWPQTHSSPSVSSSQG